MHLCRLISLLLLSVTLFASAAAASTELNLSAAEARRLVAEREDLFVLDVRTPEEYRQVRLDGARLIPIDQLVRRLGEIPSGRPILVYCAVGSRSAQVTRFLAREGRQVYNLSGGIWGWQLRGFPVLHGGP